MGFNSGFKELNIVFLNDLYLITKYIHILSYTLRNWAVTLWLSSTRLYVCICDFIRSVSVNTGRHANLSRPVQKFCRERSTIIRKLEHFRPWNYKLSTFYKPNTVLTVIIFNGVISNVQCKNDNYFSVWNNFVCFIFYFKILYRPSAGEEEEIHVEHQ